MVRFQLVVRRCPDGRLRSVKPFGELTADGQRRRVRHVARDALGAYGFAPERVRIRRAAESFNTIFRVDDGRRFSGALRVGPAVRIHAEGTEIVEARWMRQLRDTRAVSPPKVFDTPDGGPVVRRARAGVPGERTCMLFGWIRGRPLTQTMSLDAARRMGTLAALLHQHAAGETGAAPPVLIADRVLYWRVENRLGAIASSAPLIDEALDRAQRFLTELWADPPHPPHLLHGDLTTDNVLLDHDALIPIDFQDLVWGLEIQDLAISWSSLGHLDQPERLRNQFRAGYATIRPWPVLEPETLAALSAARRLHQLNLALTLRKPGLAEFAARATESIAEWMA